MAVEARELAEQLNTENLRRQAEEAEIVAQAKKLVETDLEIGSRTVMVVAGEGWHRGVIGIVASKLVDAFHRPAIVLSIDEGGMAHGSCRSIPSFNMLGALESCGEVMTKFGGHKQAAGLTIERRIASCAPGQRLRRWLPGPDDSRPALWIDWHAGFRSIDEQMASELTSLARSAPAIPGRSSAPAASRSWTDRGASKSVISRMAFRQDGRVMRGIAWRASSARGSSPSTRRHRPGILPRAGHLGR
jgi:single-stranded-DNA-specific exonuclease